MRIGLGQNGTIVNVQEVPDPGYVDPDGLQVFYSEDVQIGWTYSGTTLSAPPPSIPVLAAGLAGAAGAACASVTQQVVPDQTHQLGYLNAANIVAGNNGQPPTSGPTASGFDAQAEAFGFTPQQFASVVTAVATASMRLSALLATLQGACRAAASTGDLTNAASAFNDGMASLVQSLNSAGLVITVVAPSPLAVPSS